jgi:imidazolonepropionase-like amidohydrolase
LEADMVVLGADPLSSIEALKNIRMIINDGRVVYSRTDQGVGGSR